MKPATPGARSSKPLAIASALPILCALAAVAVPAPAAATVTPAQAELAATRGALWFQAEQAESGALPSDWGLTALAAAGISAADVRIAPVAPSAQDYYFEEWTAAGPGGAVTDAARTVLAGTAGGIQTSRLETETPNGNEVAALVAAFNGTEIGGGGLINDDVFGVLALDHAGAPRELLDAMAEFLRSDAARTPDGGWAFFAGADQGDTDMTGAAIAALCAAGDSRGDPLIDDALGLLEQRQDEATGGFAAPPFFPVNTDSTAWVASGLIRCGIDPQSPRFTTATGKTPLDFLVAQQLPSGAFKWLPGDSSANLFATIDAVRPLAGAAFSAPAPAPADGSTPAVRPAPAVEPGTEVAVSLVIDHGPGEDGEVRACRAWVPAESDVEALLEAAATAAEPAGCVQSFATEVAPGGMRIAELNGAAPEQGERWTVAVDGGPAEEVATAPIGFGDLVFAELRRATVEPPPPPGDRPGPAPPVGRPEGEAKPPVARRPVGVRIRKRPVRARRRAATVPLRCPRRAESGCRGALKLSYRRNGKLRTGGRGSFELAPGERGRVRVASRRGLARRARTAWRSRKRRRVKVVAFTRDELGAVARAKARRGLRPALRQR